MKKAVILFNLGGPDKLDSVKPFLFNLFNDPAILDLPKILRYPLAKLISNRRAPIARKIYEELGGSSPILKLTEEQSAQLEKTLNLSQSQDQFKTFIMGLEKPETFVNSSSIQYYLVLSQSGMWFYFLNRSYGKSRSAFLEINN